MLQLFLKTACLLKINSYSTSMHKWVTLLFHNSVRWRREKREERGMLRARRKDGVGRCMGESYELVGREGQGDLDLASLWLIHGHLNWNRYIWQYHIETVMVWLSIYKIVINFFIYVTAQEGLKGVESLSGLTVYCLDPLTGRISCDVLNCLALVWACYD